jgi:hypothetical protein
MSALGHKRTFCDVEAMSALPPKAGICVATRDVRFGPKADIQACNEAPVFRISNEHGIARQDNPDFSELAGLRIDLD